MSFFSNLGTDIADLLGSSALTAEEAALAAAMSNSLMFLDDLVTIGETVEPEVVASLKALETKLAPAITAAKADVKGAVAEVKTLISDAVAFVAARKQTPVASADPGASGSAPRFHIA